MNHVSTSSQWIIGEFFLAAFLIVTVFLVLCRRDFKKILSSQKDDGCEVETSDVKNTAH